MQDFEKYLTNLIGGDDEGLGSLVKRKKNAPQLGSLLPSEHAIGEFGAGAADAAHSIASPEHSEGQSAAMGALAGGLKGVQEAVKPQPMMTPPTEDSSIRDGAIKSVIAQPPPMQMSSFNPYQQDDGYRGLAYGGEVDDGEIVKVGNEWVKKTQDGRTFVIPNPNAQVRQMDAGEEEQSVDTSHVAQPETEMQTGAESSRMRPDSRALLSSPEQNGVTQTMQGDDVVPSSQGKPDMGGLISDPLEKLYGQLGTIQQEKGSPWRDAGYGALQGLQNYLNHTNKPIENYSEMRKGQKAQPIMNQIGLIEGRRDRVTKQRKIDADIYGTIGDANARMQNAKTASDKFAWEVKTAPQKDARDTWEKLPNYKKGQNPQLDAQFKVAFPDTDGLPDKENQNWTFSPDSTALVNSRTGEIKDAPRSYAKPPNREDIVKRNIERRQKNATAKEKHQADIDNNLAEQDAALRAFNGLDNLNKGIATKLADAREKVRYKDPIVDKEEWDNLNTTIKTLEGDLTENERKRNEYRKTITELGGKKFSEPVMEELEDENIAPNPVNNKVARSADVDAFAKKKGWTRAQTEAYLKSPAGGGYIIQ